MTFHAPMPHSLAATHSMERAEIRALRRSIVSRIEADLDRVDRCIAILDAITPDPDIEADYDVYRPGAGPLGLIGLSSDDEDSFCGLGSHTENRGLYSYGDREHDDADVDMTAAEWTGRGPHRFSAGQAA